MRYFKRVFPAFLVFIFLHAPATFANHIIVTGEDVNVRNGPGTSYNVIGKVNKQESYAVLDENEDWIQIDMNGVSGWIYVQYVSTSRNQRQSKNEKVTIKYDQTHIRSGPSSEYDILTFVNRGTLLKVIEEENDWYKVKTKAGIGYILKSLVDDKNDSMNLQVQDKVVVIDAGHGGRDNGALSVHHHSEKNLTLSTALKLADELRLLGIEPILTRDDDEYISLASRATFINNENADAFISLHYNSAPDHPEAEGIVTYYYDSNNTNFAKTVQQHLIHESKATDRDISYGNYQVLRQSVKPAILIELGFLSNKQQEPILLTNIYQRQLVRGIASGLLYYLAHDVWQ